MKFYLLLLAMLLTLQVGVLAQETLQPQPVQPNEFSEAVPPTHAFSPLVQVTVTKVYDGDGCRARFPDGSIKKLRFANLDAPEFKNAYVDIDSTQPYAVASRDSLRKLILGKTVYVDTKPFGKEKYSYERLLVDVYLEDPEELDGLAYLNEIIAMRGWAWAIPSRKGQERVNYTNYENIGEGQDYARAWNLGLWKYRKPVKPSYWRTNPYRKKQ